MKHKTSELTGALLDAAVAKANGLSYAIHPQKVWEDGCGVTIVNQTPACWTSVGYYEPSTDWRTGGVIIERERMRSSEYEAELYPGQNWHYWTPTNVTGHGETPLIAAMRAFVSAKFGDEVDL